MHRATGPLAIALIAGGFATFTACGGGETTTPPSSGGGTKAAAPTENGPRDMLVIGTQADLGNLNPVVYETASDAMVLQNTNMQTLNSKFDCRLEYSEGLAESWEWSDDNRTLTMKLRKDINWSDGKPTTAYDLAMAYELAGDPEVASPRIGYLEHMVDGWKPKVIDEHTVAFQFNGDYDRTTLTAESAALGQMPKHIWEGAERATLRTHPKSMDPVINGPFRLAKHEPNNRYVLEPNPAFSGPAEMKPRLKRVVFRVLPEYTTRLIALKNGEIDMMDSINVEDADRLREENPEINIIRRGWRTMDYVAWNTKDARFSDNRVRTALAMAVDLNEMMAKLLTGKDGTSYGRKATGTITPEFCDAYNDDIKPLDYNADKARELLAEAGWTDTDGDGWLDKDGATFEFTLSTNTGNKRRADVQILMQDYFKRVGVKVNLEKIESNTFFKNLREKNFEAAIAGWEAALFVDPSTFWASDTDEVKRPFNFTSYSNAKVDELIDKGLHTPDPKEAAPIWREVQSIIYADQPYLFLWWRDELVGLHSRFDNAQVNVSSRLFHLYEWEVAPDKVKYKL